MKNITVVFVINSMFPYCSGGRENWLTYVANYLAGSNLSFDVHIVALKNNMNVNPHYILDSGITLHSTSTWTTSLLGRALTIGPFRVLRCISPALSFCIFFKKWIKKIKKNKPIIVTLDTVVTPLALRCVRENILMVCASKGPHAEVLSQLHPALSRIFHKLELRSYQECDELWSNGYDMQEYIKKQGFDSLMVGNGVDTERARKFISVPDELINNKNNINIVSVGSILEIKGIRNAIYALAKLKDHDIYDKTHLYFVGKGDFSVYQKLASDLLVASKVHFVGPKVNVFGYMQHADMLLCLSGGGGLSMAALESLATGTPVIAWDTAVYRQMITNEVNGFLVKNGDNADLAATIVKVAKMNKKDLEDIKIKAIDLSGDFDWGKVFSRIKDRLILLAGKG